MFPLARAPCGWAEYLLKSGMVIRHEYSPAIRAEPNPMPLQCIHAVFPPHHCSSIIGRKRIALDVCDNLRNRALIIYPGDIEPD
jgi:hypothetical protein